MNNNEIGKLGEEMAEKYLIDKNFKIIDRNFYCKQGEIDIIARDNDELVFVEVKTRTNSKYGSPAEAVHKKKKMHIYKAVKYYIHLYRLEDEDIRFDVIEVYLNNNECTVNHIKQIM